MKKLFYLIVFLSTVFASAQGLEPKTYVGNGIVVGPKTTTEINALTVTPNGYVQVNETTGTIFLRVGGSWVNTGLASNISITDTGGNFTATDVEGALAELAASGGSGTDDQTLSLTGTTLSIENGNSVDLSAISGSDVFSSRGAPPNNTQTIAQAYPSVTLAQVQALDPSATLSDSASWFYLQEVISSFQPRFFYSSSAQSELKIPTGDYRLSRPIVIEDLANMVIDWGFNWLLPFGSYSGNALEYRNTVQNSNRDVHNINLRIRGEWQMSGVRISKASQWLIGGQIDQVLIGVTIEDSYYGGFAPTMTIRECMTGVFFEYGNTDPENEVNTINFRNLVIGGASETQVVNDFGLPSGTKRYGILSEARHSQINFNGMTIEGVDVGMLFDDTNGNITLRGAWSDFYWEDINDNLFQFNATRGNSEVDLQISGGISNIWVPDVDFEIGAKGRIQIENLAKNPGSNLGIILNNTPDNSPITLVTDFEPSRITDNTTTTNSTIIYTGQSLFSNSFGGGSLTTDQTNTLANSVLPPKTLVKNADFTLVANDMRMRTSGNSDLGRSYTMTVNDGGTTVATMADVGAVDDIGRIRTVTASDTFEAIPDTGVTLDWKTKTGTENAVRVNGKGHTAYFLKTASNNYFFYGDITGYTYTPPSSNLYTSLDAANPVNETNSIGNWSGDGNPIVISSTASNGTYALAAYNVNNAGFSSKWIDITGLNSSLPTTVTMDVNQLAGTTGRIYIADVGTLTTSSNVANNPHNMQDTPGWVTINFTVPAGVTGFRIRALITLNAPNNNDNIIDAGEDWIAIDNIIITQN